MSGWSLSFTAEESVSFERREIGAGERIIKVWHRVAVFGPGVGALSNGLYPRPRHYMWEL
jgi:hypothetical protein